jgi:hypothetical protein
MKVMALMMVVAAIACGSSTSIENSWKAPSASRPQLHRVVTVMLWKDVGVRRSTEDQLAARLQRAGVEAVPGYRVLSESDANDPQMARQRLQAQGFDGILVMRFVSRENQLNYTPPVYTDYWGGAWYPDGGYAYTTTIVRLETAAYSTSDGQLVYSALSKTTDPSNISALIDSATARVAKALEKEQIVVASRPAAPQGG